MDIFQHIEVNPEKISLTKLVRKGIPVYFKCKAEWHSGGKTSDKIIEVHTLITSGNIKAILAFFSPILNNFHNY